MCPPACLHKSKKDWQVLLKRHLAAESGPKLSAGSLFIPVRASDFLMTENVFKAAVCALTA